MLRCLECGNTYTDETLRFCLADGTRLVAARAERDTVSNEPPTARMDTSVRYTGSFEQPGKVPRSFKILLGLVALAAVFGSIGMVVFLILINRNTVRESPQVSGTPNAAATATPDAEKERLQCELAEAQRKLEEQKNSPAPQTNSDRIMARVNSPIDGFLALRVMPDAQSGEPLAKIPHLTTITLGYCQQEDALVDTRDGHWCMTSYDGKAGWVFDAWLDRAVDSR